MDRSDNYGRINERVLWNLRSNRCEYFFQALTVCYTKDGVAHKEGLRDRIFVGINVMIENGKGDISIEKTSQQEVHFDSGRLVEVVVRRIQPSKNGEKQTFALFQ